MIRDDAVRALGVPIEAVGGLTPSVCANLPRLEKQLQAVGIRGQGLAEDTQKIGYVRPCTTRMPRLAALGSATAARLYALKSAQEWQPMRTIDARQTGSHYLPWIQRHPPALQQRIVARWIDLTRASYLPGRALDGADEHRPASLPQTGQTPAPVRSRNMTQSRQLGSAVRAGNTPCLSFGLSAIS